jgi:hypothetical protein
MTMKDKIPKKEGSGSLLEVLRAHYRVLVSARCDEAILEQYSALLRFLKLQPCNFLESEVTAKRRPDQSRKIPDLTDDDLLNASLDDIEKLVTNESTPRKHLEFIAIKRFSVPQGSMRSFSNKQMLVDKLRSLIGNERTHNTIRDVASEQVKSEPGRDSNA